MIKMLTKNTKMKNSQDINKDVIIYDFAISTKSCRKCTFSKICYANKGTYRFPVVQNALKERYELTLDSANFIKLMSSEIAVKVKSATRLKKQLYIRIHSAGDFHSLEYALSWLTIIRKFPEVKFYCYTKEVCMFKSLQANLSTFPTNFTVVYSIGSTETSYINIETDRHAKIFKSLTELLDAGYHNAMENDLNVLKHIKNGLIQH